MIKNLQVMVDGDGLSYSAYPVAYPPLSQLKSVKVTEIELIFTGISEYQILLKDGNVLLFPKEKELALRELVRRHGLLVVSGLDPWNLLTDPYLDAEFTAQERQRTAETLEELGFDAAEVEAIRRRVGPALASYNFFVWEWVSLGLPEVLHVYVGASEEAYRWAIAIARRGYAKATPFDLLTGKSDEERRRWLWSQFDTLPLRRDFASKPAARLSGSKRRWWPFSAQSRSEAHDSLDRFNQRWETLQAVRHWLEQKYTEPQRHYHTLDHIAQVISLLESFGQELTTAALLAGWFHDAVYTPGDADNEARSATAMVLRLEPLQVNRMVMERARRLILYTREHLPTSDPEEQMIHDADLGIFGMDHDSYAKYAKAIRAEYAVVPEELFRTGRRKILTDLQEGAEQHGRFFLRLDPIFEAQVDGNLRWELSRLSSV